MSNSFIRGELHIFIDDPIMYLPLIGKEFMVLDTYADVTDAILNNQKEIYTTQIHFLSHLWIKAGYDIYLYNNYEVVKFDEEYLEVIDASYNPLSYYYMISLYTIGELYQTNR